MTRDIQFVELGLLLSPSEYVEGEHLLQVPGTDNWMNSTSHFYQSSRNKRSPWYLVHVLTYVLKSRIKYFPFLQSLVLKKVQSIIDPDSDLLMSHSFFTSYRVVYNKKVLDWLKNDCNGKISLLLTDPLSSIFKSLTKPDFGPALLNLIESNYFDLVFSYCADDIQYSDKFKHLSLFLPITSKEAAVSVEKTDLYLPGKYQITSFQTYFLNSPRHGKIVSTLKGFEKFNLKYDVCFNGGDPWISQRNTLHSLRDSGIPGEDLVNRTLNAKCCLVITDGDYINQTICEAVYFDRKIFTTVQCVKDQPWYNPDFVHVYDPNDITENDINWIRDDVDVHFDHKDVVTFDHFLVKLEGYLAQ